MEKIYYFLSILCVCQCLMADQQSTSESEFNKGYIFSKLEDMFPDEQIEFAIYDHTIIVYGFPDDVETRQSIHNYLEGFQGYDVVFDPSYVPVPIPTCKLIEEGNLLPELNPFFPTMLAQPHIVGYSAGYRSYDKTFRTSCLPVSIGDQFSLYQFRTENCGRLYFGVEACVWALFEARAKSLSLINADYFIALPLTYIHKRFSAKLRIFHESSHLGDEFLLECKKINRVNPSMEVIELLLSYDITDRLTTFIGFSRVLRSDDSFKIKPHGVCYGFNYFLDFYKIKTCNLEATPFIATYFSNLEHFHWGIDSSMAIGYQWDKLYGHKLRLLLEGHDGYSNEGQFSKQKTKYLAIKLLYGY